VNARTPDWPARPASTLYLDLIVQLWQSGIYLFANRRI
jgi:hypothetical protein